MYLSYLLNPKIGVFIEAYELRFRGLIGHINRSIFTGEDFDYLFLRGSWSRLPAHVVIGYAHATYPHFSSR